MLIDGRRVPYSPATGSGQDLNSIPLAAVERIEILSDGASAIYGSDAIGGVVNVITRKDFNGVEMSLGMGNPKRVGGETEEGSIIFGTASDRGNLIAGVSYNNRGIVFARWTVDLLEQSARCGSVAGQPVWLCRWRLHQQSNLWHPSAGF